MLHEILFLLAGLVILLTAGELLVRGAVDLARALRVPALVVSLTIVAFGTSAPEIFVSIQAVTSDAGGIALGNIIGSNIANILMVLGFPAIIYPMSSHVPGLRRHGVIVTAATLVFAFIAYTMGGITQTVGLALTAAIICYVLSMMIEARRGTGENPILDDVEEFTDGDGLALSTLIFIIVGLIGLPLGAHLLVKNGVIIATSLGVRETIIGLTVIAFGTSLPELATVISAALKKKSDVAIGSIVGSNIFNLLAVGGATGLAGGAVFDPVSLRFDLPVMVGATLLLFIFIIRRQDIGRVAGLVMAGGYVSFIATLAYLNS
ncbi:MAG: calcium/sodium antiporter [Pseudomonadota bacterium]